MENVPNRIKVEFIRKVDTDKNIKQQSKLTFKGIHKSYEYYESCKIKQNEVLMDKSIYLGFSILELTNLLVYETNYNLLSDWRICNHIIWILIASY